MEDDFDNFEDISKIESYAKFLDRFVTDEDRMYLEDEELARDVKELYAVNKGEIRSKADFERKKKEIEEQNREEDTKERPLFSLNMNYRKGSFLDQLKDRESEVRNGRKSTIIFIRYKDKKGKETSAYIDYRERLKNDEMDGVFKEGRPLLPKPTDLSYYNWTLQKVNSQDSTFFRVDAGPKERLSFKNNTDRKKREIELLNREDDSKERPLFSLNMNYKKGSFLDQLQERESEVRNGRKSTIIFIRYKDKKGKETSAYIDYRERLKSDDMEGVFKEGKPLLPKPTDLSYYNWTVQKVLYSDSTFFRVDAGPKERLSFKNNTDRKIINVDLEYLDKHPNLDVKRIPINFKNRDGAKDIIREGDKSNKLQQKIIVTPVDVKKENLKLRRKTKDKKDDEENKEEDNWGYQQIVIFDYETRSK